jgi:UDP-N-acetylmuramoylalanine--D-glutamate ligase
MKKILIYGMGKTGIELKKFCKRNSINFCTFDDKTDNQSDFIKLSEKCSYIVVSPGIGLRNKNLKIAIKKKIKIISEIEFASKFLDKPIIAITGTNGKTTTAMLTEKLLTSAGIKVFLGGNIGTPLINAVNSKEKFDLILVEVSSFQLQFIDLSFKPFVSALLNISENHLDHHLNFREYKESKMKIFKNQNKTDYSLIVQTQFIKKNIRRNR